MRCIINNKRIICCFVFLMAFFCLQTKSIYAADLKFYNYATDSDEIYKGKQVSYTFNNRELRLDYPGILVNGTALADYEDLFVNEIGLTAERSGDNITLSDGATTLTLTIGSKKVLVNGISDTVDAAPMKLKFDENIKYYVPTCYVAETFGYDYVWVASTITAKITKTVSLACEDTNISYNGNLYTVRYKNNRLFTDLPVIFYDGCVMAPAKQIFEAAGCSYQEENNVITVCKDELVLTMERNSKAAYINGKKIIGMSAPIHITEIFSDKTATYIPLEMASELLGFVLTYSDPEKCFFIEENEFTGKISLYPDLQNAVAEEQPAQVYFEWNADENINAEKNFLSGIKAYALENADVVELYGISKKEINDFFDNGLVIFELNDVYTNMETMYFSNYDAAHLSYALITEVNSNIKLFFLIPVEDEWSVFDTKDGVRVYFYHKDLSENYSNLSDAKQPPSETKSTYPDDKVIIPLPENIEFTQVSDEDIYWENKFLIKIAGNHEEFYKEQQIINPYYGIRVSEIQYDFVNNLTSVVFETNTVCGYNYYSDNGYLVLNISKPGEIYSKVVVFDAGHGGIDPGASKSGFKEKDISFKIINTYVKDSFADSDIKVYFTRNTDTKIDLYERAAMASKIKADMFISLHLNANNSSALHGTEVYYSKDNHFISPNGLTSYQLSEEMVNDLSAALGTNNRGVKENNFVVVKYNTVPAVLIELGYMTNKTELSKLTNEVYQKKTAETIYNTVKRIFETYY